MLLDDTDCVDGVRLQPSVSERELYLLAITTAQSPSELHPESKGGKVMRLIIVGLSSGSRFGVSVWLSAIAVRLMVLAARRERMPDRLRRLMVLPLS